MRKCALKLCKLMTINLVSCKRSCVGNLGCSGSTNSKLPKVTDLWSHCWECPRQFLFTIELPAVLVTRLLRPCVSCSSASRLDLIRLVASPSQTSATLMACIIGFKCVQL